MACISEKNPITPALCKSQTPHVRLYIHFSRSYAGAPAPFSKTLARQGLFCFLQSKKLTGYFQNCYPEEKSFKEVCSMLGQCTSCGNQCEMLVKPLENLIPSRIQCKNNCLACGTVSQIVSPTLDDFFKGVEKLTGKTEILVFSKKGFYSLKNVDLMTGCAWVDVHAQNTQKGTFDLQQSDVPFLEFIDSLPRGEEGWVSIDFLRS